MIRYICNICGAKAGPRMERGSKPHHPAGWSAPETSDSYPVHLCSDSCREAFVALSVPKLVRVISTEDTVECTSCFECVVPNNSRVPCPKCGQSVERISIGIILTPEMIDDMEPPRLGRIYMYLGTPGWHSEWNLKSGGCYDDVPEYLRIHPEDLKKLREAKYKFPPRRDDDE